MKKRFFRWLWFTMLIWIDEFFHFLGIDWYWFCQYAGLGWFNVWDDGELLRFGPFMHTWRGWYFKHKPLTKNIIACTDQFPDSTGVWTLWERMFYFYRHVFRSADVRWRDVRYHLRNMWRI